MPQAQDAHADALDAIEDVLRKVDSRLTFTDSHAAFSALALVRSRLVVLEQERDEARRLLGECLWDEEEWDCESLVELAERVYVLVGGSLDGPPAAVSVADIPQEGTE